MICSNLLKLTGFACHPIDEQGSLAQIVTPFSFADGDPFLYTLRRSAMMFIGSLTTG